MTDSRAKLAVAILLVLPLARPPLGFAKSSTAGQDQGTGNHTPAASLNQAKRAKKKTHTARWLELKTLSYSSRYRDTTNLHGQRLFHFGQERYVAEGKLKLDKQDRYSVNVRASSGRYFNWSYADLIGGQYKDSVAAAALYNTPEETAALQRAIQLDPNGAAYSAGIPSRGGYFYPRELYFSATPLPAVTFEFGSLGIERGQNSEITSFDDDGYISGERIRLHDPEHLYFNRIVMTWAYMGSPLTPNFFARGKDLTHSNYEQELVERQFGKYVTASADYTRLNHARTVREAATIKLPGRQPVDGVRLELYQRLNYVALFGKQFARGEGFAVSAHNGSLRGRLATEIGFAQVDERYSIYGGSIYLATAGLAWNGDDYETGKRIYGKAEMKMGHGVSAFGFFTHATAPIAIGHNQQGWTSGMSIDLKEVANSAPKIFR